MVAPAQEVIAGQVNAEFAAVVAQNYGQTGADLGYSQEEVMAAFPLGRVEDSRAVLEVGGVQFSSWRHQVGVLTVEDRSRGGLELSPGVTDEKVQHKARIMNEKHLLAGTGNVGGKGGIAATREELAGMSPEERRELLRQHAEAHGINPYTNVTAMDIGTFGEDMDAIAAAIAPSYGRHAGAAASGASERFGGEPQLHAPRTGLGGSIVLDHYLRQRAAQGDERVIEAINGGRPLTVLIQGLGKAGMPFLENLPPYVQPKGVLEQHGAIVAKDGHLDREEVAAIARQTKLSEEGVSRTGGALWLPPSARSDFWASGADIIAPAFDRNQFNAEDAEAFGGMVIGCLANDPVTPDAYPILAQNGVDVLPDSAFNAGGTISSQGIWEKIVRDEDWTPVRYETTWRRGIDAVAETVLRYTAQLRAESSSFVPIPEAVNRLVVDRAVQRFRAVA